MTLSRSMGARFDGALGTTPLDVRKIWAGLLAPGATGTQAWRQGVFPGCPPSLVVGATNSSGYRYQVLGPAGFAIARATNDGAHIFPNDGTVDVPVAAAPGTAGASRWDLIYVEHPSKGENSDTSSTPVFGVRSGDPSTGTPVVPALQPGQYELARNLMTSAATSTLSAGNTITQTWRYTALLGQPIPVRNQAERDELNGLATAAHPIWVERLDLGILQRSTGGTTWGTYGPDVRFKGYIPGGDTVAASANMPFLVSEDTAAAWNAATKVWTCPKAGTYRLTGSVKNNSVGVSGGLRFLKNGGFAFASPNFPSLAFGGINASYDIRLAVGDTIAMQCTTSYVAQSDAPADNNFFQITQVQL